MTGDLPNIAASSYTTNTLMGHQAMGLGTLGGGYVDLGSTAADRYVRHIHHQNPFLYQADEYKPEEVSVANTQPTKPVRRVVQVFIADPNENVPLEQSLLYQGEVKVTDLTDQELFFEIDIKTILTAYNEKRVKIINKKVKDRTEYLEPVKIRDLKMVVVTVASF